VADAVAFAGERGVTVAVAITVTIPVAFGLLIAPLPLRLTRVNAIKLGDEAKASRLRRCKNRLRLDSLAQSLRTNSLLCNVVTADGHDLDELLVSSGLARMYGTPTPLADGRDSREYLAHLHALEIEAKAVKRGGWVWCSREVLGNSCSKISSTADGIASLSQGRITIGGNFGPAERNGMRH
jgi:hypothetical protein